MDNGVKTKTSLEKLREWAGNNHEKFAEAMEDVRVMDVKMYAKMYIDVMRIVAPKTTEVNVQHGLNSDMRELMRLGGAVLEEKQELPVYDPSISDLEKLVTFTPYEEVQG